MADRNKNTLQWRHNGRDSVSNHQPHDCLLNRLFRRRSQKTSKLRVIDLCAENSPVTGEFPAQMASNAENASIWWRHHEQRANNVFVFALTLSFRNVILAFILLTFNKFRHESFQDFSWFPDILKSWNYADLSHFKQKNHKNCLTITSFRISLKRLLPHLNDFE